MDTKVFRTTISIPEGLKARMDAIPEDVNWSRVAAEAFEAKLAELAAARKERTVEDAVQRMRASMLAARSQDFRMGWDRGHAFVLESPDWAFCSQLKAAVGSWDEGDWKQQAAAGRSLHEWLLRHVDKARFENGLSVQTFAVKHMGDAFPSTPEFMHGWCAGVLDTFREIEQRLSPSRPNRATKRTAYDV